MFCDDLRLPRGKRNIPNPVVIRGEVGTLSRMIFERQDAPNVPDDPNPNRAELVHPYKICTILIVCFAQRQGQGHLLELSGYYSGCIHTL